MLWVSGINDDAGDIYQEGIDQNYFLRASAEDNVDDELVKGDGRMIDYFNPGMSWWHGLVDKFWQWGSMAGNAMAWITTSGGWVSRSYRILLGRDVTRNEYWMPITGTLLLARVKSWAMTGSSQRDVDNYGFRGVGDEAVQFAPRDVIVAGWVGDQDEPLMVSSMPSITSIGRQKRVI